MVHDAAVLVVTNIYFKNIEDMVMPGQHTGEGTRPDDGAPPDIGRPSNEFLQFNPWCAQYN